MKGSKTEIWPDVWRMWVYVGRRSIGTSVRRSITAHAPGKNPEFGAGARLSDRDLAKLITEVSRGRAATGAEMVGDLHERFLKHAKSKNLCLTMFRGHKRITDKELRPGSAHSSSSS